MNRLVLVTLHLLSAAVYGGINDGIFEMMIDALKEDVQGLKEDVNALKAKDELLVKRIEKLEESNADLVREKRMDVFDDSYIWPDVPNKSKGWLVDRLAEEGWFGESQASPKRCYRGRRGDASVAAFHKGCDHKGRKTITFIMTHDDSIFGAVTSVPWKNKNQEDNKAFLISLKFGKETTGFKLPVKKDNQFALRGGFGPTFGGGADIYVGDTCLDEKAAPDGYSNVGSSYVKPTAEQEQHMKPRDGNDGWQFTKSMDDRVDNLFKCRGVEVWYLP